MFHSTKHYDSLKTFTVELSEHSEWTWKKLNRFQNQPLNYSRSYQIGSFRLLVIKLHLSLLLLGKQLVSEEKKHELLTIMKINKSIKEKGIIIFNAFGIERSVVYNSTQIFLERSKSSSRAVN